MSPPLPPFGITICGIEELQGHCDTGASHVLSILDPDHPVPEAFGRFGEHDKVELRFHDIIEPTPGQVLPEPAHVEQVLALGRSLDAESLRDAHLLVHCHIGVSRSTASMALILAQAMPELDGADILRLVYAIRQQAWPNLRLMEMGDARLGRGGSLVSAATALYRLQLDRQPKLAEIMTGYGRGREVEAAQRTRPLGV